MGPALKKMPDDALETPGRSLGTLLPKKRQEEEPAGVKRILIELQDNPEKAGYYSRKYSSLLDDFAAALEGMKNERGDDRKFLLKIREMLDSHPAIKKGIPENGLLWQSLEHKAWDCDMLSVLVFDVLKKAGVPAAIAFTPSHALIKIRNFYFETTNGDILPAKAVRIFYPELYSGILTDPEKIQMMTYHSLGLLNLKAGQYELAIKNFEKAVDLCPWHRRARMHRAVAIDELNSKKQGLE